MPLPDEPIPESKQQPVWHVIVLCILTCTAYVWYWFYKNWRDLSDAATLRAETEPGLQNFKDISPMLRTIGSFIPIWALYLWFTQFKGIAQLNPNPESYP